jgi:toxin YoeB
MTITFSPRAWYEYTGWQLEDKKTLKRINALIKDIDRNGNTGIGKPEPLKNWDGYWSRRIDDTNRLVYKISGTEDAQILLIAQCKSHYE